MTKELVIERLKATQTMLKNLGKDEFAFDTWISGWDNNEKCGTVCCVGGWYPKYFPEANLIWINGNLLDRRRQTNHNNSLSIISAALEEYHGVNESIIDLLFCGKPHPDHDHEGEAIYPNLDFGEDNREDITKDMVIQMIDNVLKLLEIVPKAILA